MKLGTFVALAALAVSPAALAHPAHGAGGALQGFAHPFLGVDHLLAMLAVGCWAARYRGAARWVLPASFVACMFAGALLAQGGVALHGVETVIAASVLVLGAAVAASVRLPAAAGAILVGAFALFHGHAHVAELPVGTSAAAFAAGMLAGTAALHCAGVLLAQRLGTAAAWLPRVFGAATALAGAWLLVA